MPAIERAFTAQPSSSAGGSVIASPFQFTTDPDTFLRAVSACSVAGVTIAIQGRRWDERGNLVAITEQHTPNSDRSTKTQDYAIGAGAVLNLTTFASAGSPLVGQCYVMIQLLRNFGGTAVVLGTLLAGYITARQALGFPGSPIQSSILGEPTPRVIAGTLPPAGVDLNETVPTGARWELLRVYAVLVTNATVISRWPFLGLFSGGLQNYFATVDTAQQQGTTGSWKWAQNLPISSSIAQQHFSLPLPLPALLLAGNTFGTVTVGMQAADQYTQFRYVVREWLEVAA